MTLTELSVFMKKQELELQLRTEKEKEEGEYRLGVEPDAVVTQHGKHRSHCDASFSRKIPPKPNYAVHEGVTERENEPPEIIF